MESSKKIDNKKLTKILFITGFSLLLLFIMIRLIFKSRGDRVTDMPSVGELTYNPEKIQEQSKTEQFEEQRMEKQRKEMGLDENNYVIPSFHELRGEQNITQPNLVPEKEQPSSAEYANYTTVNPKPLKQQESNTPASKLNFHSDYYDSPKKEESLQEQPIEQEVKETVQKNPFGTIYTDIPATNQKQTVNTSSYFTAEIYGDQKIENGGVVVIRNTQAITNSPAIPQNSILYGQATFQGNRVLIKLNRAKTKNGEFSINFSVNDNDRIEGIYYKAPIDETVDKTKEETEVPAIPGTYGKLINTVSNTAVRAGKELMKKNSALQLQEGYKIFIIPIKQN